MVLRGQSLKSLIITAFNLGWSKISGGEPWIEKDLYDVEAKPPETSPSTHYDLRYTWWRIEDPHLRQMPQALLIDRFRLKLRAQSDTGVIYLLETTGKTPLLQPTTADTDEHPFRGLGFSGDIGHAGDRWVLYNVSMPKLAKFICDMRLHTPVLDHTGLSGSFDAEWPRRLRLRPLPSTRFPSSQTRVTTGIPDHAAAGRIRRGE